MANAKQAEGPGDEQDMRVDRTINKELGKECSDIMKVSTFPKSKEKEVPSNIKREIEKHIHNIRIILSCSNATLIRKRTDLGYVCFYCASVHQEPMDLKRHTLEMHSDVMVFNLLNRFRMPTYLIKLDISYLCCSLCYETTPQLDQLIDHLQKQHEKEYYTDINNHILPFKFDEGPLTCVLCSQTFNHYKDIQEHMNEHYKNYVCETCSAPFVNKRSLQAHQLRLHKQGDSICSYCPKVFDTSEKCTKHEKTVHTPQRSRYRCQQCLEKFSSYIRKMMHMVQMHGVEPVSHKCLACDRSFATTSKLAVHRRRDHMMERPHLCQECGKGFYCRTGLRKHMMTHAVVRQYQCSVCGQNFSRRQNLVEHMSVHDVIRYSCEYCSETFDQKSLWEYHVQCKHGYM